MWMERSRKRRRHVTLQGRKTQFHINRNNSACAMRVFFLWTGIPIGRRLWPKRREELMSSFFLRDANHRTWEGPISIFAVILSRENEVFVMGIKVQRPFKSDANESANTITQCSVTTQSGALIFRADDECAEESPGSMFVERGFRLRSVRGHYYSNIKIEQLKFSFFRTLLC